jgi:hypothetical protein
MSRAPFLVIDGRLYRWKDILELRRAQLAAAGATQASQLALFATLHDDRRPPAERTASGRNRACSKIRPLKQGRAAFFCQSVCVFNDNRAGRATSGAWH